MSGSHDNNLLPCQEDNRSHLLHNKLVNVQLGFDSNQLLTILYDTYMYLLVVDTSSGFSVLSAVGQVFSSVISTAVRTGFCILALLTSQ